MKKHTQKKKGKKRGSAPKGDATEAPKNPWCDLWKKNASMVRNVGETLWLEKGPRKPVKMKAMT